MGSATHDWPGHVDSVSLLHKVFYKWRIVYLRKITFSRWFQQTLVLLKNIPARFPAKESNHTQCGHEIQPTISEADPFLCLIHSGVSRDTLSFNPDFQTFHFVKM